MRAYTVASLASAWKCSEGVIRKLIADGRLGCFRVGTLIRIPAEEVRRFECQNIPSNDSGEAMPAFGETQRTSATGNDSTRPTGLERRRKLGGVGPAADVHIGPWGR